jgi:hypothetical protein
MVEANVNKREDTPQPQDLQAQEDETAWLIEALDKKHAHAAKILNERLVQMRQLKEDVSVMSLRFAKLDADETLKLKNTPMFFRGLNYFTDLQL